MVGLLNASFAMADDPDKVDSFVEEFKIAIIRQCDDPLCYLNGHSNAPFIEHHWDQMNFQDQTDVAIKYAAFFGIGYLGDMMEKSD